MQVNFLNKLQGGAYLRFGSSQIRAFSEYYAAEEKFLPPWDRVLKRLSTGPTCAKVRVSHVTHHAKSVRSRMC